MLISDVTIHVILSWRLLSTPEHRTYKIGVLLLHTRGSVLALSARQALVLLRTLVAKDILVEIFAKVDGHIAKIAVVWTMVFFVVRQFFSCLEAMLTSLAEVSRAT